MEKSTRGRGKSRNSHSHSEWLIVLWLCDCYLHRVYLHLVDNPFGMHFQLINHITISKIDQVISSLIIANQQTTPTIAIFTHRSNVRFADIRKVT